MAHSASVDRQYLENGNTHRITSRSSQKAESMTYCLSHYVALLEIIAPVS